MDNKNIFEEAAIRKLRFQTTGGTFATENLYDLSDVDLNKLYQRYKKEAREDEDSLIKSTVKTKTDIENELRLAIIVRVFEFKKLKKEQATKRAERARKRAELSNLIGSKQNEAMQQRSIEDLMKELEALENEEI